MRPHKNLEPEMTPKEIAALLDLLHSASLKGRHLEIGTAAGGKRWPQESAQDDKWSFCLRAGTLWPRNQERA